MPKKKIFISSVQAEFKQERQDLYDYLLSDPLLGKFFEPFLFELLPAIDNNASNVFYKEIELSDVYIGLFGKDYGFEDNEGVSPTEREFDHAGKHKKTRLVFLTAHSTAERHPKQIKLIEKAQEVVVRKRFTTTDELKYSVYAALVRYLVEKEIIRTRPFDASLDNKANIADIDNLAIENFVSIAKSKRGFPLMPNAKIEKILTHLNLLSEDERLTNAALLLFGKQAQKFFINSEVRCVHFHGTIVAKPIPSYKVFKGNLFEIVDNAIDFVLSKLDYSIETRKDDVQIPGAYEIPKEIVAEAIVNAIVHRDYTSNGSVQIMLFSDRLEIWNPGSLPLGWTTEKLKKIHNSIPANPLIAEPMYLAGYIERLGTGTSDMVRIALESGLKEPEFIQDDEFRTIIYRKERKTAQATEQVTAQATAQATVQAAEQVDEYVKRVVLIIENEMSRAELMEKLQLSHRQNFIENYLDPAINNDYIEPIHAARTSPNQKYRLTKKGLILKKQLNAN